MKLVIDDETALALYREGAPDAEIAAVFGLTRNAVTAWRKRHGLPAHTKGPRRKLDGLTEREFRRETRFHSYRDAAEIFQVHHTTLIAHARREGWI